MIDTNRILQLGKEVIATEAQAVSDLGGRVDAAFAQACQYLLECEGHIVVIGMGKSGHIANKIAATLASTGSPAFFVHPGEAGHGDLGMITKGDIVLAISNSGNTAEIVAILPVIKKLNVKLITLTGKPNSTLAKEATVNLDISTEKEACPLGLAPTASTTAALAMGDALAIVLLEIRGFNKNDFALSHPGGILGKRLILTANHLMRTANAIPIVKDNTSLANALLEMNGKRLGMTTVVDNDDNLIGIFTDGDLRRTLDKNMDIHKTLIVDVMVSNFKTIKKGTLAIDVLNLMENHKITSLIVTDDKDKMVGVIHMHDILSSGII